MRGVGCRLCGLGWRGWVVGFCMHTEASSILGVGGEMLVIAGDGARGWEGGFCGFSVESGFVLLSNANSPFVTSLRAPFSSASTHVCM